MKIYTKTGDDGSTGLYGGKRRRKDDVRIEAYGAVDELQAALGVALALLPANGFQDIQQVIQKIQFDGFVACSELARTETKKERKNPVITAARVSWLEDQIDHFDKELPELRAFIMQGGAPAGAELHVARAVCRRAERRVIALHAEEPVREELRIYLNRLSDLLFTLARTVNLRLDQPEVEWHI